MGIQSLRRPNILSIFTSACDANTEASQPNCIHYGTAISSHEDRKPNQIMFADPGNEVLGYLMTYDVLGKPGRGAEAAAVVRR